MKFNITFALLSLLAAATAFPAPRGQDHSIVARDQLVDRTWGSDDCTLTKKLVCKFKKCGEYTALLLKSRGSSPPRP